MLTIAPFEISHQGEKALEMSPVSGPRELATAQTFRVRHQDGSLLINVTLLGASLDSASLVNTNMTLANLDSAILTNADMSFANLSDTDLSNADLTSAILPSATLTGAQYDEFTVFPSGDTYDIPAWDLPYDSAPWDLAMEPAPEPSVGLMLFFGTLGLCELRRTRRTMR